MSQVKPLGLEPDYVDITDQVSYVIAGMKNPQEDEFWFCNQKVNVRGSEDASLTYHLKDGRSLVGPLSNIQSCEDHYRVLYYIETEQGEECLVGRLVGSPQKLGVGLLDVEKIVFESIIK